MGDSECLLHGFSYASAIPNESKQGNPMHVLGESISFGRFTTESLSWEKWSTFSSHKRYVEEAESYAQPGSVAQKKAFFEAHYKRIAAQKAAAAAAAAALEQQIAAKPDTDEVFDNNNNNNSNAEEEEEVLLFNSHSNSDVEVEIQYEKEDDLVKINSVFVEETCEQGENGVIIGNEVSKESHVKRNSDNIENQDTVSASESSETPQMERSLLKNSVNSDDVSSATSKKRSSLSSLKTSIHHKTWRVPSSPAKQVTSHCKKENNVITGIEVPQGSPVKSNSDTLENQDTVSASESSGTPQIERPLLKQKSVNSNDVSYVTSKKRLDLSAMKTSIQHKTWRGPSTPTKQVASHFKKENNVIHSARKSNVDSLEENRSSPKSLQALLNLFPNNEPNKEPVFPTKKTQSSGLAYTSCATPFKTPAPTSRKSASTHTATTPRSENRRMKTPIDPSGSGRKTTGPKWHVLSAVCAKSLSAYRNKLQSPTISTPFTLRTEERAAKRKQKLEEKFNASEVQKMQVQKTLKEKAGDEFRKLSCSLCFKARPLPDFYKEKESTKNQMQMHQADQHESVVLGRNMSNKKQGTASMPPRKCIAKSSFSKNLSKKNVLDQSKLFSSTLAERIAQENASPNIRQ